MSCAKSLPPFEKPYLCECAECGAERAVLQGHWFEQQPGTTLIKCVVCGLETAPRGRGEPTRLHAVYCYPDPLDDPHLPRAAHELNIRTKAEGFRLLRKKDLPFDVLEWLFPPNPEAEEIKAFCIELIRAATATLATGVPTRRLFVACRRALERERRSMLPKTKRRGEK